MNININTSQAIAPGAGYQQAVGNALSLSQAISASLSKFTNISVQNVSGFPNLSTHIQAASALASNWNTQLNPALNLMLTQIKSFNQTLQQNLSALEGYVASINQNPSNKTAIAGFKLIMGILQSSSNTVLSGSTAFQKQLVNSLTSVSTLLTQLSTDDSGIQQQVNADMQMMQNFNQQELNLEGQVKQAQQNYENQVSNVFYDIGTMGVGPQIALVNLIQQLNTLNKQMVQNANESNELQTTFENVQTVYQIVSSMVSSANEVQSLQEIYLTNWQSLNDNLSQLISLENFAAGDGWAWVPSDLTAVAAEWQDISKQITTLT